MNVTNNIPNLRFGMNDFLLKVAAFCVVSWEVGILFDSHSQLYYL